MNASGPTLLAYSPAFLRHRAGPQHPERPERLAAIVAALQRTGLWERVAHLEPAPVDDATLELVHTAEHIAFIRGLGESGGGRIDADTAMSDGSLDAALRAVGALVEATDAVTASRARNALCLVRPPGHHATPTQAMGFCLFNNVAVAAAWLLREQRAERVAILDYDVHHGNGTQDAFVERADVLYVSTHQYPLYPGTGQWTRNRRRHDPQHPVAAWLRRRRLPGRPNAHRRAGGSPLPARRPLRLARLRRLLQRPAGYAAPLDRRWLHAIAALHAVSWPTSSARAGWSSPSRVATIWTPSPSV